MKKIIYTRPDGGVSVVHPMGGYSIEEVLAKDVPPDAINPQIVDESDIPSDKENRDCWKVGIGNIEIDALKLQEKNDKKSQHESKKSSLTSKLKISSEDLTILKEVING